MPIPIGVTGVVEDGAVAGLFEAGDVVEDAGSGRGSHGLMAGNLLSTGIKPKT